MRYQHFIPQHLLSRMMGRLATCRCQVLKNKAIKTFIKHYGVDMSLAQREQADQYEHFNDFFTRHLKADVRPIDANPHSIISPVDGCISELGTIESGQLLQAKGQHYALQQLLAGEQKLTSLYQSGAFLTAYLSPKDYHRVHMPVDATLEKMLYVPGKLFSVNKKAVNGIPGLFARNERVICQFNTDHGPMALILVGAMIVGSMATPWQGVIAPQKNCVQEWNYQHNPVHLNKGDEAGYFQMGSTIILLFPQKTLSWEQSLKAGDSLKMGQAIAHYDEQVTSSD